MGQGMQITAPLQHNMSDMPGIQGPYVQQALCTFIPGPNSWALNDLCGADWSAVCQSIWHQVVLTMGCKSGCSLWNEVVCCWTCRWWWHHGSASSGPTMVVSVWHLVYLLYRGPGPASSSGTHSALTNFTFSLLQPLAGESGRQQHVVCTGNCYPCVCESSETHCLQSASDLDSRKGVCCAFSYDLSCWVPTHTGNMSFLHRLVSWSSGTIFEPTNKPQTLPLDQFQFTSKQKVNKKPWRSGSKTDPRREIVNWGDVLE